MHAEPLHFIYCDEMGFGSNIILQWSVDVIIGKLASLAIQPGTKYNPITVCFVVLEEVEGFSFKDGLHRDDQGVGFRRQAREGPPPLCGVDGVRCYVGLPALALMCGKGMRKP